MKFSVLLSIYQKETAEFFDQALSSIENQTYLPSEIVIVKDGPLTQSLEEIIEKHCNVNDLSYKVVALKQNMGLGYALNEGLQQCNYNWVARMDTDDIALPDRFEKQCMFIQHHPNVDIVGGWICEFDDRQEECHRERRVPCSHEDIVRYAKYRNPMNHMTVMFRKQAIMAVGGYKHMRGFEDYYLWMRMMQRGCTFSNLPDVLVKARAGQEMITRRQGLVYATDELTLEKEAYRLGFWHTVDLIRNMFTRVLPRLLPVFIVEKLYNFLRKT